jgi:hypothetical protein
MASNRGNPTNDQSFASCHPARGGVEKARERLVGLEKLIETAKEID